MTGPLDMDWYFDHVGDQRDGPGGDIRPLGPLASWDLWWRDQARHAERTWPDLAPTAAAQGLALTTAQLGTLGVPRHVVRRLVTNGTWCSSQRGTVALVRAIGDDNPWVTRRRSHALDCIAAALLNPGQVIGARSAAILRGLPTLDVPRRPELIAPAPRVSRRSGARIAGLTPLECTRWRGVPVTSIGRTVVDLARYARRDGLMAADAALHENAVEPNQIDTALARAHGWPGVRKARAVLGLASPKAESALESLVRLALHDSGFPPPKLQLDVSTPGRRRPYRVDFIWPERRLILEADGRVKYRTGSDGKKDPAWEDKKRETGLRRAGFEVERVLWSDVMEHWPEMVARLRAYFS